MEIVLGVGLDQPRVERSNSVAPRSASVMGRVNPSITSCITGRPLMGSRPST